MIYSWPLDQKTRISTLKSQDPMSPQWEFPTCVYFSFFLFLFCGSLQLDQMKWRIHWRLVWMEHSIRLWNISGSVIFLPSEWLSCRPPASLRNMPTSSASSSKLLFTIFPLEICDCWCSFYSFTCKLCFDTLASSTAMMRPSPLNP